MSGCATMFWFRMTLLAADTAVRLPASASRRASIASKDVSGVLVGVSAVRWLYGDFKTVWRECSFYLKARERRRAREVRTARRAARSVNFSR